MTWILIAYLLVLVSLAFFRDRFPNEFSLGGAWLWFVLIPISRFFFALIRAGNIRSPRDLVLIEIWQDGLAWLFLGISLLQLKGFVDRKPSIQPRP